MKTIGDVLAKFFGVIVRPQTYLNAFYLILAFPLGLFYFIFLVVGFALGIPLIIVWVGLLILLAVFAIWYALVLFERQQAIWLLQENIPPISRQPASATQSIWQSFTATLTNPVTWKGLVFLFAKFPLGIVSFVVVVAFGALSGALLTAPLYYWWANPVIQWGWGGTWFNPVWVIDSLPEALLASFIGIFVLLISLHIWNGLAWLYGKFAWLMLGSFSKEPAAGGPSTSELAVIPPPAPETSVPTTPASAETELAPVSPTASLSELSPSEPGGLEAKVE